MPHKDSDKVKVQAKAYRIAHLEIRHAYDKAYRASHLKEKRVRAKVYRVAHREEINAHERARHALRREQARARHLKRKYKMSILEFNALLAKQGGICAVCGMSDWGHLGPVVDHNHETGKVRGVLCFGCNSALGGIRDDPKIAGHLAEYLERNGPSGASSFTKLR